MKPRKNIFFKLKELQISKVNLNYNAQDQQPGISTNSKKPLLRLLLLLLKKE